MAPAMSQHATVGAKAIVTCFSVSQAAYLCTNQSLGHTQLVNRGGRGLYSLLQTRPPRHFFVRSDISTFSENRGKRDD